MGETELTYRWCGRRLTIFIQLFIQQPWRPISLLGPESPVVNRQTQGTGPGKAKGPFPGPQWMPSER